MNKRVKIIVAVLASLPSLQVVAGSYQDSLANYKKVMEQVSAATNELAWQNTIKLAEAQQQLDVSKSWYQKAFNADALSLTNGFQSFLMTSGVVVGAYALYRGGVEGLKDLAHFKLRSWFNRVFSVRQAQAQALNAQVNPRPVNNVSKQASIKKTFIKTNKTKKNVMQHKPRKSAGRKRVASRKNKFAFRYPSRVLNAHK